MGTRERRERERSTRRAAIVTTARELAEQEGWDAVTTRRLADRIEYSQPVLYSHFAGKGAIITAVARQGFAELARLLEDAQVDAGATASPRERLEAALSAYLAFAAEHPATYHAMFTATLDLTFASDDTPAELRAAFAVLRVAVTAATGADEADGAEEADGVDGADGDLRTELVWSTLHGLATLQAGGRVPGAHQARRIALLVRSLTPGAAGVPTAGGG